MDTEKGPQFVLTAEQSKVMVTCYCAPANSDVT